MDVAHDLSVANIMCTPPVLRVLSCGQGEKFTQRWPVTPYTLLLSNHGPCVSVRASVFVGEQLVWKGRLSTSRGNCRVVNGAQNRPGSSVEG